MKVSALNKDALTPEFVLHSALEHAKEMKAVYIVSIPKDDKEEATTWATGDLTHLAFAAMLLQDLTFKYINGCIEDE